MQAVSEHIMRITGPFIGLEQFVQEDVPLAPYTWFKIGGPARWMICPRTVEELQEVTRRCVENEIPVYVLGLGANLLVKDQGVKGAVVRLSGDWFGRVEIDRNIVRAGAGADIQKLVLRTVRQGLDGIQCLAGIPGTVGGGIRMNCGGKFGDIGGSVTRVTVMDTAGTVYERTKDDLVFGYRHTNIAAKYILDATLELAEDEPDRLARETRQIWMHKRNSQPLSNKSAGCMFKNPPEASAGALIDRAGLKGTSIGGAEVSTKHANFVVARHGCTADDVLRLIDVVREKVRSKYGIELELEVEIWG